MAQGGQGRELPYMAMGSSAISLARHDRGCPAGSLGVALLDWLERKWLRLPLLLLEKISSASLYGIWGVL